MFYCELETISADKTQFFSTYVQIQVELFICMYTNILVNATFSYVKKKLSLQNFVLS